MTASNRDHAAPNSADDGQDDGWRWEVMHAHQRYHDALDDSRDLAFAIDARIARHFARVEYDRSLAEIAIRYPAAIEVRAGVA